MSPAFRYAGQEASERNLSQNVSLAPAGGETLAWCACEPSAEFGQNGLTLNRSTQQFRRIHPLESLDVESQRACETPCNPTIFPPGEVAERLAAVLKAANDGCPGLLRSRSAGNA